MFDIKNTQDTPDITVRPKTKQNKKQKQKNIFYLILGLVKSGIQEMGQVRNRVVSLSAGIFLWSGAKIW